MLFIVSLSFEESSVGHGLNIIACVFQGLRVRLFSLA